MEMDQQLFLQLNALFAGGPATLFFRVATHLGNGLVQAILVLPLLYWLRREQFRRHVIALVLTGALGGLFVSGLKVAVDRERPFAHFAARGVEIHAPGGRPSDRSFPSGHTQTAFSTATYLSLAFPLLAPLMALCAGAVGLSRVALGVHFPLDVLAGAIIGIAFGAAGFAANRAWWRKRETKP